MKLSQVHVQGFRSLKDVKVNMASYSCLIGKNDCGKSSFLRSIQLLLDPKTTHNEDDFSRFSNSSGLITITGKFMDVPDDCPYRHGNSLTIRRNITRHGSYWEYLGKVPENATLHKMLDGNLTKQEVNSDHTLSTEIKNLTDELPKGKVNKEGWQKLYSQLLKKGMVDLKPGFCKIDPEEIFNMFQVVLLSADMRAEEESSGGNKSTFSKIGGFLIRESVRQDSTLQTKIQELHEMLDEVTAKNGDGTWKLDTINQIQKVLNEEIQRFDNSVEVVPEPISPNVGTFDFGMRLDVSDGLVQGLTKMGHGLRRSVVFAMLRTLARMKELHPTPASSENATSEPTFIFLIEEPELYLHPQAERKRMKDLELLSQQPNAQVCLCTHSAFFVDLICYKGITRFERPSRKETKVCQWTGPDLTSDIVNLLKCLKRFEPTNAAMLFADLTILAEGQTERVCIPPIAESMKIDEGQDVEIVDCGGNENVPVYMRLANGFGLKYVAWIDSDCPVPLAKARSEINPTYGQLVVADGDWENTAGITVAPGQTKVSASWQHFVVDKNPVPMALEQRIRAAYEWKSLDVAVTT